MNTLDELNFLLGVYEQQRDAFARKAEAAALESQVWHSSAMKLEVVVSRLAKEQASK